MRKEKWLPVVGYEGRYFISDHGRVKNAYGKILRSDTRLKTGYKYVILRNGTSGFHANIHRLVALAFIPNPDNLPIINHKNENRADNRVENLEWCTMSYNIRVSTKFQETFRAIIQKNKSGEIIGKHASIHEAARAIGKPQSATAICKCARVRAGLKNGNPDMTVYGFIWEYERL